MYIIGKKPDILGRNSQRNHIFSLKNPTFMLAISLIICLISALGANLVTTGGGAVTVKELRWETPSGYIQAARLLIPKTATAKNPAPAIVAVHGWSDNNDIQDAFFTEYSRRGYVVLAIDMYGHGNSEAVTVDTWWNAENGANGTYDGVKLLASLPYVDSGRIGVTGHSNGAWSCNYAVLLDNEASVPLISSVFLVNNDAFYTDDTSYEHYAKYLDVADTNYANSYGTRDIGMVASQHDFLFHRVMQTDGTLTSPVDFINQPVAQSFLYFGNDPTGLEKRDSNIIYTDKIDGKDTVRVIYNPDMVHTWGFFSERSVKDSVEFFQTVLPAPNPIAAGVQVWQWKAFFNTLGVAGLFMFFTYFILSMLNTGYFCVLKAKEPVLPMNISRKGIAWMWGGLIVSGVFSAIIYPVIWVLGVALRPGFMPQERTWTLALWSLASGLFTLLVLHVNYRKYAKANGLDLQKQGAFIGKDKLGKSILLGLLAAVATYSVVFIADFLFKTDYHAWILFDFHAFDADKLIAVAKVLPFIMFFYIISSISTNVFNYFKLGKKEWINPLIVTILSPLAPIIFFASAYGYFYATGLMPFDSLGWGVSTLGGWLVSVAAVLPVATIISRVIYKATKNPYIHGFAFSILITIMMCTNALTVLVG